MAYKPNVQYIRCYTDGTAARKLDEPVPQKKHATLPKPRKVKYKKIYVDPVAILGVLVAVCMLIVMSVSICQLEQVRQDRLVMEQHVARLTSRQETLEREYAESYDLEEIEKTALALGMIPSDQATTTTIHVTVPQPQEEPTVWETLSTFLTSLFA